MARKCIIFWPSIIWLVKSISSDIRIPDITSIVTNDPIVNETMYAAYPNLWDLDMSNQTDFDFPVDQVLLIHDELSRFVLNNCGVQSIYRESLSKIPQLTHLMMENNSLQYVHPDAFQHNTRLEKISFAGNQLSTMNPEAMLRHIPGLAMLDMSGNAEFDLNRVDLQGTRLFFFTCKDCHTTFLDRKTLSSMPRLSQLYLTNNGMERIDDDALAMVKYVKILNVDRNQGLVRLNLRSESLKKLSAGGCSLEGTLDTSKLPVLEYINVRGNRLTQVDELGFMQNPAINAVLLDDNLITRVPTDLLNLPLNGLKQLCLDRNPLQPSALVDEAKTLYSARKLRKSCLDDGNHLKKFENYLPNANGQAVYKNVPIHHFNSAGKILDFSNRDIGYIDPDFLIEESNVTEVLFDNNHSFDFKEHRVFLSSSWVEVISLKNCSITEIYETTFEKLPQLEKLDLRSNMIKSIGSNSLFRSNPNLRYLNLKHNNLEFIAAQSFKTLEHLEDLHLDWNERLSNKANTPFLMSTSLRRLSCTHCRFERLDGMTLAGLPNLLELNLDSNYLTALDFDALQSTTHLKHLHLSHNHLVVFEPNINQLSHLKVLCLEGNSNLDLEHDRNKELLDNMQKMVELNKKCKDNQFKEKLDELYRSRTVVKQKSEKLQMVASMMSIERSSAVSHTVRFTVPVLLGFILRFIFLLTCSKIFCWD